MRRLIRVERKNIYEELGWEEVLGFEWDGNYYSLDEDEAWNILEKEGAYQITPLPVDKLGRDDFFRTMVRALFTVLEDLGDEAVGNLISFAMLSLIDTYPIDDILEMYNIAVVHAEDSWWFVINFTEKVKGE
jgi:hypothetical protein